MIQTLLRRAAGEGSSGSRRLAGKKQNITSMREESMNHSRRAILLALLAAAGAQAQRPVSLFVERVFTPDRSRQLKVALHANLWVLYDQPQCQLYQAWAGGTKGGSLQQANFGWFNQGAHFPHWYTTEGTNYFKEAVGEYFASWTKPSDIDTYYTKWKQQPRNYQAWTAASGGQAVAVKTRYRGYTVKGPAFTFQFSLKLPAGEVSVVETPDYGNAGGKTNLIRKFAVSGLPAGHTISLKLPGAGWSGPGVSGSTFTISANGESTLTGAW